MWISLGGIGLTSGRQKLKGRKEFSETNDKMQIEFLPISIRDAIKLKLIRGIKEDLQPLLEYE